ncbi:MAG: alcohol dehydrogenase catalytic domain-containing protein [Deltaproteobacteria bacterium]|nr:alcohol dehydrogenase catalytic domain-containing protein [Deltaproteobacteria bacterium]
MSQSCRGATLVQPEKIEIREYPIPDVPPNGGLVAVERAGVCGTDVKYLHGKIELPLPVILGHEILGRVVKLGREAAAIHGLQEGDRIILKGALGCGRCADCRRGAARFCRKRTNYGGRTTCAKPPHLFGGFADYIYLAPDALATKVSDRLPAEAAVLIGAVMANGFQWAVRQGGVKIGDFVLIQGPGQQGLASAFAARQAGAARVFISGIGRDAERLALAERFGAHRTINVEKENVAEVVRNETGGAMADVVVDVSGSPKAIQTSVECVRRQGTIVLGGLSGDSTATPMLLDKLVWGEIRLQGVFTADNGATEAAMRLVEATGFPVEEMVSHVFPIEETERCIRAVGGEIADLYPIKALIKP